MEKKKKAGAKCNISMGSYHSGYSIGELSSSEEEDSIDETDAAANFNKKGKKRLVDLRKESHSHEREKVNVCKKRDREASSSDSNMDSVSPDQRKA